MEIKVNIECDLEHYFGNWGAENLDTVIKDKIKSEVLRKIADTPEYKKAIKQRFDLMMEEIDNF